MARTKQSSKNDSKSGSKLTAMKQPKKMIPASHSPRGQGQPLDFHSSTTNQPKRNKKKRKKIGDDDGDDDDDYHPSSDCHPSSDSDAEDTTTLTIKKGATGIATSHKTTSSASATLSNSIDTAPTGMVVLPPAAAPAAASLKSTVSDAVGKRAATRARATSAALLKSTGMDAPHAAAPAAASLKSSSDTIATADGDKKAKAKKPRKDAKKIMHDRVVEMEKTIKKIGIVQWCNHNKPKLVEVPPHKFTEQEIDGKKISAYTIAKLRELPVEDVKRYSQRQLKGILYCIGGETGGKNSVLIDRVVKYINTGDVKEGHRMENASHASRQIKCNTKNDNKLNVLDVLFLFDEEKIMTIETGKIVIAETPRGKTSSNFQYLTDVMGDAWNINGEPKTMMNCFIRMNFLIGPSTHGYYSSTLVRATKYENERIELIHPDITPDYQPPENAGTMRKWF